MLIRSNYGAGRLETTRKPELESINAIEKEELSTA
jgi:hypothetical protein